MTHLATHRTRRSVALPPFSASAAPLPSLLLLLLVSAGASARSEAASASSWTEITPGGDTICSDGSPFRFFVSPGSESSVVFEFEGGGCCFNALTCFTPIYKSRVMPNFEKLNLEHRQGIGSFNDPRNPVQNWTRVFIPYCTGDAHTGNNTASYATGKIHHKGLVNARSALDYAFEHFASPDKVFVTGISAGAVATYVLAPWIFGHYTEAQHFHLADSYAPVFGETGYNDGLENWKMAAAYDTANIGPLPVAPWRPLICAANVNSTALAFPNATWASYVSADDTVEEGFYVAEGGGVDGYRWAKAMREALDGVPAHNFARFIAKGSKHGVLDTDGMYTKSSFVSGTKTEVVFGDWLRDMLDGKQVPMNVDCKGQGC